MTSLPEKAEIGAPGSRRDEMPNAVEVGRAAWVEAKIERVDENV